MDKEFLKSIILPVGLLIIGFLVLNKIFGFTDKWKREREENKRQEDTQNKQTDEVERVRKLGIKPSYPPSKYKTMADSLFTAMKGVGTDETRIFQVISSIHNDADFLQLQLAFGTREDENLTQWINGDLSSSKVAKLNAYLRKTGIKYSF